MSRIKEAFQKKKAFIGFLTAGDPSLEKTEEFIVEMDRAGAAIIEIGIPFSDPIAEGPVVQNANVRALSAPGGCTTDMVFDMVSRVRKKVSVPLVFRTYLNPVFKYGYEAFCQKCQETEVDGILIPDLPYDEKAELAPIAETYGVDIISLIAPASESRIQMIARDAKGYMRVTGVKKENATDMEEMICMIRSVTDTPVSTDAGNAIVEIIEKHGNDAGKYLYEYVKSMTS